MQHISLQFSQSRYSPLVLARQTADAAWRALMDSMQCIVRIWTIRPSLAGGVMA
ncbi:hypothetical protein FOZ70_04805 [Burkholderia sp. COPS]|uniref:hypothetical protein n=1 Tax=Burkholderia sp. COPS TaxID=2597663 RepID=UPI001CA52972|nr:hypothetical protein [Burkholderia sp. COPS]MBW5804065.1 hypothetical protein [Burkholderia sp. COPS]